MRAYTCLLGAALLGVGSVGAGCADRGGGGGRDGGAGMDGAIPEAGHRDSGARDAGRDAPALPDAARDARADTGIPECRVSIDCPPGQVCVDGMCSTGGGDCCKSGVCPPGLFCNYDSCGCEVGAGDCCDTGFCPDPGMVCNYETCGCIAATGCCLGEECPTGTYCDYEFGCVCLDDGSVCAPPCADGMVCDWGLCYPPCALGVEECPDGTYCDETSGCVPAMCTRDECLNMGLVCDPPRGCYDPCTERDWSWCTSSGGRCYLGSCIDDACSASMGIACHYRYDCCGEATCVADDDPFVPGCPAVCEPPDPVVREDTCQCGLGGGCVDLRDGSGGGPIPFPGGEDGSDPMPAPPPPPR